MSLFKQLQTLVTVLLVVMLAIVLKINFDNAREFTANQLYNTSKNVANVLALSLGPQTSDQALMETTINAMFDGGHFESITLTRQDGSAVYRRVEPIVIDGVPAAFLRQVDLHPPAAEAQVSAGWSIFGTLRVKGHPGAFYISLWNTFKRLCILFVILGGLAICTSYLILRLLLQSLQKMTLQAEAISNNEFIHNETIPRAPELRQVVLAMNNMVEKVQQIFNRQLENIKYYQEMQFKDSLTGLHNRKYFVQQLNHFIDSDDQNAHGQVLIIAMVGMEKSNISAGHPIIQGFYNELSEILQEETQPVKNVVLARLPQNEFGAILPDCKLEIGKRTAESILVRLKDLIARESELAGLISLSGGVATYNYKDNVGSVLSKTDYALSTAKSGLAGSVVVFQENRDQAVLGKFEWKTMIESALADGRFFLTAQPVMADRSEYHKELYINLEDADGTKHRAGYFMPMATNLGQAGKIDQYVLELAVAHLKKTAKGILAVNVTREFCKDRLSFTWLRKFLFANKTVKDRLVIEIHDNTLIQHPDICLDFAGMLKGMGYGFGVDQCTMTDVSLDLIKHLKPQYIKIDYDFLQGIDDRGNTEIALNALLTITDSLGIELIATKVENETQRRSLVAKNINCFQGHGIADIAILES